MSAGDDIPTYET